MTARILVIEDPQQLLKVLAETEFASIESGTIEGPVIHLTPESKMGNYSHDRYRFDYSPKSVHMTWQQRRAHLEGKRR